MFLNALINVNIYFGAIVCSFVAYVLILGLVSGVINVIKEFFNLIREWASYRYVLYRAKKIHERKVD